MAVFKESSMSADVYYLSFAVVSCKRHLNLRIGSVIVGSDAYEIPTSFYFKM